MALIGRAGASWVISYPSVANCTSGRTLLDMLAPRDGGSARKGFVWGSAQVQGTNEIDPGYRGLTMMSARHGEAGRKGWKPLLT